MAVKLDKETLIKHRFWIGLGVFGLLWLILFLVLWTGASGAVAEQAKKYNEPLTKVKNIKDIKNPNFTAPVKEKEEALKKQKDKVWEAAWSKQDGLMTWPGNAIAPLDKKLKNAYFGDDIADRDRREYGDTLYRPQLAEYINAVAPAVYNGGSFETILHPVAKWSNPTTEEVWLAQEDLWVKREMIAVIRDAIDSVAHFKEVKLDPAKDKLPAGAVGLQRFKNPNWQLDLVFEGDAKKLLVSSKSRIKNIHPEHRLMMRSGMLFLLQQQDRSGVWREPVPLLIEGEPLAWDAADDIKTRKPVELPGYDPKAPLVVDQVFNWYTSPIKRVDRIETGNRLALSHRSAKWGLQAKQIGKKDATETTTPAPTGGGTGTPGGFAGIEGGSSAGSGAAAAATATQTPNGLEKNRYLDVSDQARRMPVAMVLVVDQAYIQEILTAVANSRLRMWTTQWHWQHTHGIQAPSESSDGLPTPAGPGGAGGDGDIRPPVPAGGPGGVASSGPKPGMGGSGYGPPPNIGTGGTAGVGAGGAYGGPRGSGAYGPPRGGAGGVMGQFNPAMMQGGMGGFPGGMGGVGGMPLAGEQEDPNLVELSVYSIATLYERYPPKAAGDGTTPGTPPSTTPPPVTVAPAVTPPAATQPDPAQPGVEQPKPSNQPPSSEQPKSGEQTKPAEQPKNGSDQPKTGEQPKPVDQPKPGDQPKPADQPKPGEQPKP